MAHAMTEPIAQNDLALLPEEVQNAILCILMDLKYLDESTSKNMEDHVTTLVNTTIASQKRIRALEAWVIDLQSGMCINCVYCGHQYGPRYGADNKVPVSMANVLKEHIEKCPDHPMSALKDRVSELEAVDARVKDLEISFRHIHTPYEFGGDRCRKCGLYFADEIHERLP